MIFEKLIRQAALEHFKNPTKKFYSTAETRQLLGSISEKALEDLKQVHRLTPVRHKRLEFFSIIQIAAVLEAARVREQTEEKEFQDGDRKSREWEVRKVVENGLLHGHSQANRI